MPDLVERVVGDVIVIDVTVQKILSDVLIVNLGRKLLKILDDDDVKKLVVDFKEVTFLSSAMIGQLRLLKIKGKKKKVPVIYCSIAPSIMEVFVITRLTKFFDLEDDIDAALRSLK